MAGEASAAGGPCGVRCVFCSAPLSHDTLQSGCAKGWKATGNGVVVCPGCGDQAPGDAVLVGDLPSSQRSLLLPREVQFRASLDMAGWFLQKALHDQGLGWQVSRRCLSALLSALAGPAY